MTEHTPLPWALSNSDLTILANPERPGYDDCCIIADLEATDFCAVPDDQAEANAALIVRAVNCHDDLLAALETLYERMTDGRRGMTEDQLAENADLVSTAVAKARKGE